MDSSISMVLFALGVGIPSPLFASESSFIPALSVSTSVAPESISNMSTRVDVPLIASSKLSSLLEVVSVIPSPCSSVGNCLLGF